MRCNARIEKLNFKGSIGDRSALTNELIEPRFCNRSIPGRIHVASMSIASGPAVDQHAITYRGSRNSRSHDEMQISGVKAICDPADGVVE